MICLYDYSTLLKYYNRVLTPFDFCESHTSGGTVMIRCAVSAVVGFILIFIECMIVMKLKGYQTIEFGGIAPFINVWAMNFFFVFAILTQVINWYETKEELKEDKSI